MARKKKIKLTDIIPEEALIKVDISKMSFCKLSINEGPPKKGVPSYLYCGICLKKQLKEEAFNQKGLCIYPNNDFSKWIWICENCTIQFQVSDEAYEQCSKKVVTAIDKIITCRTEVGR